MGDVDDYYGNDYQWFVKRTAEKYKSCEQQLKPVYFSDDRPYIMLAEVIFDYAVDCQCQKHAYRQYFRYTVFIKSPLNRFILIPCREWFYTLIEC